MRNIDGAITAPQGYTAGGIAAGQKKSGLDLAMVYSDRPATGAAVFTTNKVKGGSVLYSIPVAAAGGARAFVVNSGNANACVGERALEDATRMAETAAKCLAIPAREVLVCSTGVIGVPLAVDKLCIGIEKLAPGLSVEGHDDAVKAIMTTDAFEKTVALESEIGGTLVRMGGMAKGAGMIAPNMATMLCFLTTDAAIETDLLRKALKRAVDGSFNRVTVDGDTSCDDTVAVLANGAAGNGLISSEGAEYDAFCEMLDTACLKLALDIVRDGEGASKLVEMRVTGAPTKKDADLVARAVAESVLVKTAFFGEDANWGRIINAAGYSKADIVPEKMDIFFEDLQVCREGEGLVFDEEAASRIMARDRFVVRIDLGQGNSEALMWTSDLGLDYVKLNSDYRS